MVYREQIIWAYNDYPRQVFEDPKTGPMYASDAEKMKK